MRTYGITKTDFVGALWPFLVAVAFVSWIRMAQPANGLLWLSLTCKLAAFPLLVGYRVAVRGGQARHAAVAAMTLSVPDAIVTTIYFSDFKASLGYVAASAFMLCPIQALFGTAGKLWAARRYPEGQASVRAHDLSGAALLPKLFFYLAAYWAFKAWKESQHGAGWTAWLPDFLIAGVLSGVGNALRDRHSKRVQLARDNVALDVLGKVKRGEGVPRFYLFLRPFVTTSTLTQKTDKPSIPLAFAPGYSKPEKWDFESWLANALANDGLLVGLGRPGEAIGAGRLSTSEDEWREEVVLLFSYCACAFVIPGAQSGTRWEVETVKRLGLLQKAIFIMPPFSHDFDVAAHWQKARSALSDVGVWLPEYQKEGSLFTVRNDGQLALTRAMPSSMEKPNDLRKALSAFLEERIAPNE